MTHFYFDYNATSPLSSLVLKRLRKGEVDFFNSSSLHFSGRHSLKKIHEVQSYLLSLFSLEESHEVMFHSGATEGVNTIVSSWEAEKNTILVASPLDHACVRKSSRVWRWLTPSLKASELAQELEIVLKKEAGRKKIFVNWTWVHNETGVIYSLSLLEKLKKNYDFYLHIDGAQAIGKIEDWQRVPSWVDAITFSGHKFGALKGVGFSFLKKNGRFKPLLKGGGQQRGLRSGTLNTLGIISLKDALEDVTTWKFSFQEIQEAKEKIEEELRALLGGRGEILGANMEMRNNNTLFLILNDLSSDRALPYFDLNKMAIGQGAACSSGAKKSSELLLGLGYDEKLASHGVRISFIPYELPLKREAYMEGLKKVFLSFLGTK